MPVINVTGPSNYILHYSTTVTDIDMTANEGYGGVMDAASIPRKRKSRSY